MSNCNNCNNVENCYGNEIYDGCVKSSTDIPYLGISASDSYKLVTEAIIEKIQNLSINPNTILFDVNLSCFSIDSQCLENLSYTYTTSITATGFNLYVDISNIITTNSLDSSLIEIVVMDKNMTPIFNTNSSTLNLLINNLQMPVTVRINIYAVKEGKIIYLSDLIVFNTCMEGTFTKYVNCNTANTTVQMNMSTFANMILKELCALKAQLM